MSASAAGPVAVPLSVAAPVSVVGAVAAPLLSLSLYRMVRSTRYFARSKKP